MTRYLAARAVQTAITLALMSLIVFVLIFAVIGRSDIVVLICSLLLGCVCFMVFGFHG